MARTNTLAYYDHFQITDKKRFYKTGIEGFFVISNASLIERVLMELVVREKPIENWERMKDRRRGRGENEMTKE